MKKNILILGTIAIALTAVSCSKDSDDNKVIVDPVETMPEGTADVTINETDANYADYATQPPCPLA